MAELAALMEAAHGADAAALAGAAAWAEDLRRRAEALKGPAPAPPDADPFVHALASRHDAWRQGRRRQLLQGQALAMAEVEEARARARLSFGRARAAEALAERAAGRRRR